MLSLCAGLQSIIDRYFPKYGRKVKAWKDALDEAFSLRSIRDGKDTARKWLLPQLVSPRLPDLRQGKSYIDDLRLAVRYDELLAALKPVFTKFPRNPNSRNLSAARIVSSILDRTFLPADLPTSRTIGLYCRTVLNTTPSNLARARRRVADEDRKKRATMTRYFTKALSSPNKTPHDIERLQMALDRLKNAK